MASNFNKYSSEYTVFKEYLPRICDALTSFSVIISLARNLQASRIISTATMCSVSQSGSSPYDHAFKIMSAALVSVEQDPSLFYVVTEKLEDQGLRPLVRQMNKSLVAEGVRSEISRPRSRSPTSRSRSTSPTPSPSESNSKKDKTSSRSLKMFENKDEMKILVVGRSGSGKSSLINKMLSERNIATVGRPDDQIGHDPVEKYRCKVGEIDVTIYDTLGFSDPLITGRKSNSKKDKTSSRSLKMFENKDEMKILVVGHNGSGKSSLINEMLGGRNIATVGRPDDQIGHDPVEKHRCKVGGINVTIYDTRGLSDPLITDQSTMNAIVDGIESIDIVLICHKLYDRIDDATVKELKVLVGNMHDDLIDLSILVFTFGDEYQIRCDPVHESEEEIKENMKIQQHEIQRKFKDAMKKNGINEKVADRVPSCITCGKRNRYGEQKELPTSDNWVDDLWKLCEERCKPEARPFVRSMRNTVVNALMMGGLGGGTVGAVVGGIASGIQAGATLGTVVTPGLGTLAGAVVGFVAGGIVGGISGTNDTAGIGIAGIGARVANIVIGKKFNEGND